MICVVPDVPESHFNLQKIFELTGLNEIKYTFVADFKLLLVAIGKQNSAACHPCPYCLIHKDIMKLKHVEHQCVYLTFGQLEEDERNYVQGGKVHKRARLNNNTINPCLVEVILYAKSF